MAVVDRGQELRDHGEPLFSPEAPNFPSTSLKTIHELYDRDYYLTDCEGFREFRKTRGGKLSKRLAKCLSLIEIRPGMRVIDIGCGRGELAWHAATRGAVAVAVDPSPAALALTSEASPGRRGSQVGRVLARGEQLPIASDSVDRVVLSDVIEHIPQDGFGRLLMECARVLRPEGRLIVHTQPNRILVDYTVPILSRISKAWGVALPRDLRDEMSAGSGPRYHLNEQSFRGLRRALGAARLRVQEIWLEGSYPVHRIFGQSHLKGIVLPLFRRYRWIKELLASQVFAVATKELPHQKG